MQGGFASQDSTSAVSFRSKIVGNDVQVYAVPLIVSCAADPQRRRIDWASMIVAQSSTSATPMVIAHRGASGYRPEHSRSAYVLAALMGADALEPDVVPTKDGVLVARHENNISDTTDVAERPEFAERKTTKVVDGVTETGWFTEDFTWDELSTLTVRERLRRIRRESTQFDGVEPMLRLRDVLGIIDETVTLTGRELQLVLEVKHPTYFETLGFDLVALLHNEFAAAGWSDQQHRIITECFELGLLRKTRAAGIGSAQVFLVDRRGAPADSGLGDTPKRRFAWYRSRRGLAYLARHVDGVSVHKSDVLAAWRGRGRRRRNQLVRFAHRLGLSVYTWTLRPENLFLERAAATAAGRSRWGKWRQEFASVLDAGVDGIFVDHPDLGVHARRARGQSPRRGDGRRCVRRRS